MTDVDKKAEATKDEVLSFEAITAEMGDITIPVKDDVVAETDDALPPDFFPDIGGAVVAETAPGAKPLGDDETERINRRVLTGCSPQTRHMYVEGLFCAGLAALFMVPIIFRTSYVQYQPWFSYMAMLLSCGAALWSLSGLQVETKIEGRRMCIVSALICITVAVIAFCLRGVR